MTTAERVFVFAGFASVFAYAAWALYCDLRDARVEAELREMLADHEAVQDDANRGLS